MVPPSCALLGGFAIGARVELLWQHSGEREMSASALYSLYAWFIVKVKVKGFPILDTERWARS